MLSNRNFHGCSSDIIFSHDTRIAGSNDYANPGVQYEVRNLIHAPFIGALRAKFHTNFATNFFQRKDVRRLENEFEEYVDGFDLLMERLNGSPAKFRR